MNLYPALQFDIVHALVHRAAELTGLTPHQILGERRSSDVTQVRFAIVHVARQAGKSSPQIGAAMNRDHSTILHAEKRAAAMLSKPSFAAFCEALSTMQQVDHFTAQAIQQMLSYQSDAAISRYTGAPISFVKLIRAGSNRQTQDDRRFTTYANKEPIDHDSTAARFKGDAKTGSDALLRRQLATGQHFLSAERFHSTLEALAA